MIRKPRWQLLAMVGITVTSIFSCDGCPSDPGSPIPPTFGTLNPLFDRAAFVDFDGAIIDPTATVPVRFRVELVLPAIDTSIDEEDVRAYVVPDSLDGRFESISDPPLDIRDNPVPLTPIAVTEFERVSDTGGDIVALVATLDRDALAGAPDRDLVVQLNPGQWQFSEPVTDEVFRSPMRFVYRISPSGPDGDPPYLADASAISEGDFSDAIGQLAATVRVAPHSPIRLEFSEPMYQVSPLVDPQDPAGFQPRIAERADGGIRRLESATRAGLIPFEQYCVNIPPPGMADLGILAGGAQDLSGEPLVPFAASASVRRALAAERQAVDICFTTGALRIEQPRASDPVGVANALFEIQFIGRSDCGGEPCAGSVFRLLARARGSDDELGEGWLTYALYDLDDPEISIATGKQLIQGERQVDVFEATIFEVPLDRVPIGGGPLMLDLPRCTSQRCNIDVRIDLCDRDEVCTLGDVIPVDLFPSRPPAPERDDVIVVDSDTNDGVVDRVCAEMDAEETVEILLTTSDDDEPVTVQLAAGAPGVVETVLEGGRVRRCVERVSVPSGAEGEARRLTARVTRVDAAGQPSEPLRVDEVCRRPPRRHIGFDGRRSAMALDSGGVAHVVYATNRRADEGVAAMLIMQHVGRPEAPGARWPQLPQIGC